MQNAQQQEAYSVVGRLVSRGDVCGLFIPMQNGLSEGVWEVRRVLGELQLVLVGPPAMPRGRFRALGLEGLFVEREMAALTPKEYQEACCGHPSQKENA